MTRLGLRAVFHTIALCVLTWPTIGQAQKQRVNLTGLNDVAFGDVGVSSESVAIQSVCAYSSTNTSSYFVTAIGMGATQEFALESVQGELGLEVQWSDQPNQTSGEVLRNGESSSVFYSDAIHQKCNRGPSTSATIIFRIRQSDVEMASAGTYSGTVTFIVAPM